MSKNPFEILLDEDNTDNIIFYDENQNPMEFEQVALITLDDIQYAILHPVNMGYKKDEVIVYSIYTHKNQYELIEVEDEHLFDEINEVYMKLRK